MTAVDATPRRGRPRQHATDQRITEAALALLREAGPQAVTMAAVASRSGVARTTLYRRHRDRRDLLRASLSTVTDRDAPPAALGVEDKLRWVLARTQEILEHGVGIGGVSAVLVDSDPEFSAALRDSLNRSLDAVRDDLAADAAAGRLDAALDAEVVVDLVLGAYLAEVLRHGHVRRVWKERTATMLSRALTDPQDQTSSPRSEASAPPSQ